jgi:hypothetical protein
VNGFFLLLPLGTTTQNEDFLALRRQAQSNLQSFLYLLPLLTQPLPFEALQHAFGSPQNVTSSSLLEEFHIVFTGHTAIHHPDPTRLAVLFLDRVHHLFHWGRVMTIAGENLLTQRQSLAAHHQGNVHLFAIRAAIARITPLRLRVFLCLAFKVGAGHVVKQQIVFDLE